MAYRKSDAQNINRAVAMLAGLISDEVEGRAFRTAYDEQAYSPIEGIQRGEIPVGPNTPRSGAMEVQAGHGLSQVAKPDPLTVLTRLWAANPELAKTKPFKEQLNTALMFDKLKSEQASLTPYQSESLKLQRERLNLQRNAPSSSGPGSSTAFTRRAKLKGEIASTQGIIKSVESNKKLKARIDRILGEPEFQQSFDLGDVTTSQAIIARLLGDTTDSRVMYNTINRYLNAKNDEEGLLTEYEALGGDAKQYRRVMAGRNKPEEKPPEPEVVPAQYRWDEETRSYVPINK